MMIPYLQITRPSGVVAAGNWIVDHVKLIERWPEQDTLVTVTERSMGNGGSPFNVLVNLARLGARFPLSAVGVVGADPDGDWIHRECAKWSITTQNLRRQDKAPTSWTDVMTVSSTGRRTFFHQRGANALLDRDDFQFQNLTGRIFHLGYLLLLDRLDAADGNVPRAAGVLRAAQEAGFLTSVDCVSESPQRFQSSVLPVLPYTDIFFANDYEAQMLTGVVVRRDGLLLPERVESAAHQLLDAGVPGCVVLHFPEGAMLASRDDIHWQPSLRIPPLLIKGAAGAGDALAAGVLFGIHEGWTVKESLELGVCVAAASLQHPSCSQSIGTVRDCQALALKFGWNELPARLLT